MVKMNIGEVSIQTQQIVSFCQKASQAVEQASVATQSFGGVVGLTSEAFTNFKAYISEVYPTTAKAITMVSESAQKANEAYKEGYLSEVGSETLDSDELEREIQQAESLLAQKNDSLQRMFAQAAEKEVLYAGMIQSMKESIALTEDKQQKLQEKLTKLLNFEGKSTSYFDDVALDLSLLSKAMTAIGVDNNGKLGSGAWNGTRFSMADKTWIREINVRWDEKEQLKKLEQQELFDKNVKKLEKYHVYCAEITDQRGVLQKVWVMDKNGKRIWDEELQEFLEKNGSKLPKSMVDIVDWKKLYELELASRRKGYTYLTPNTYDGLLKVYVRAGAFFESGSYYAEESGLATIGRSVALGRMATKMESAKNTTVVKGTEKASGAKCFVSGTLILTEHGHKPIESIRIGEKVLASHENSHVQTYEKVVQLFVSETNKLVRITVDNEMIETTTEHPFYVPSKGWVEAKKLVCHDNIIDSDGNTISINDVEVVDLNQPIKVYNFEVENAHTYFVSSLNILVHNDCSINAKKWHQGSFNSPEDSLMYHFKKHGSEVGATNVEQYLRKAEAFGEQLRGARTKKINYPTPGVTRYYKNGKYIDKIGNQIISFGKQ